MGYPDLRRTVAATFQPASQLRNKTKYKNWRPSAAVEHAILGGHRNDPASLSTACQANTSCASLRCSTTIGGMSAWSRGLVLGKSRLFLLLVGLVSTPGLGLTSFQRSHCASHEVRLTHAVQPEPGHAGHHGSIPSWSRPAHADCSHCPPSECASLAPCAVSAISLAVPTLVSLQSPSSHRVGAVRTSAALHSTTQKPPTPPPQSIA